MNQGRGGGQREARSPNVLGSKELLLSYCWPGQWCWARGMAQGGWLKKTRVRVWGKAESGDCSSTRLFLEPDCI